MKQFILTTFISILFLGNSIAQNSTPNIFIDCQMRCQERYIKEQITFVNYMRDRQQADIYILATRRRTGAGGSEVQLAFEGNNQFKGILDTVTYIVDPNATESIERDQMVLELKKGLLGYIIRTDLIDCLNYTVECEAENNGQSDIKDPWNYWVFNIGGNGWINGEASYNSIDLSSRLSANRITDKHKFIFSARTNYAENTFKLTDGDDFTSTFISYNLYLEYVKSLGEHWSIGGVSRSGSSTFGNTDVRTSIKGALEYNFYPYTESQTRRFSFFYTIGPEYYNYTEPTFYGRETEWVGRHGLNISFEQTQKWGNVSITLGTQQYFHNLSLYNAYLNPRVEWQIFKGLSFNFGGFFSFVTDRINIAQSDISDEDILLQVKQLDTDFTYHSFVGLNYRFGSKYNNFVNPRF